MPPTAYPNIKLTQDAKVTGAVRIVGPLGDDPPGLIHTDVFATVTQEPDRSAGNTFDNDHPPVGTIATGSGGWDAGTLDWNVLAEPPAGQSFDSNAWAWVNALAIRRYDNGNMDTLSWSRWVQIVAAPTTS